ncbi:MAG: adenylyltransferase/cytidyltransferase family protein [Planctomycetota bacterium]|nr:adenylyltransferase/cytidyltransferase family protein [Planctomycetota bacterium]
MTVVAVTGSFDDLRARHVRFLDEAAKLGDVHVMLWSDEVVKTMEGRGPKFPIEERLYFVQAIRYVKRVSVVEGVMGQDELSGAGADVWAVDGAEDSDGKKRFCEKQGLGYRVIGEEQLRGFPIVAGEGGATSGRKKVLVTGCYDWLHTGHVRFLEECSELGELYVVVGQDANIAMLKGAGHPMFGQDRRRYMVGAIRHVKGALVSTGMGWLDAEPEIAVVKPKIYAVNEDGDKPEKREYCQRNGLEYVVLKRLPKEGLERRQSTALRGF